MGLAVAFATSFAHFLIVGTPNNAIVYGLGVYPDTGERAIHPVDFLKYGFVLWVICMLVVWVVGFLVIYNLVGLPGLHPGDRHQGHAGRHWSQVTGLPGEPMECDPEDELDKPSPAETPRTGLGR